MKLVDAHCHLESEHFINNLDEVIDDAKKSGIVKLITCSITPSQWEVSRSIAESHKEVEFAMGIHPWYISQDDADKIDELTHAADLGACAIGEIGLDKKISHPGIDEQVQIFEAQLKIAKEINLPVIMHCRGAFNELELSLKRIGAPAAGGIIHSFNGSIEVAENIIKHGISFSIGGILTYRNSKKREGLLNYIYPEHFLLETDSPDIPPVHLRGKPNIPSNIVYNLAAASEIIRAPKEEIAEKTTSNAVKIFNLKI